MKPPEEQDLLEALRTAEHSGDPGCIEQALGKLALFYSVLHERHGEAAPYWRRQAQMVMETTSPTSREFGTFLHTMAVFCLIPAGLNAEARSTLQRVRDIYALQFPPEDKGRQEAAQLLQSLGG